MTQKKKGKAKWSTVTLISLTSLYVLIVAIPALLRYRNAEEAIVLNLLQITIGFLAFIFTIIVVTKNNDAWPAIIIIPVVLYIGSLSSPFTSPYTKFPLYVAKCHGSPIVATKFTGIRPGITGWAQVNGRNAISWSKKLELDVWYVEHLAFLVDIKILWMTFLKVIKSEGVNTANMATTEPFNGNN